ncbi:hypothetical protein NLM27_04065 [Bradyrhizobium sp. CCGB12]|uniref:hypothetical protein n=1 Tax=Bradyrhizobium sp. CCGB12 TaxID=2949632 RepID=UPI0020B34EC6|nr:hypothetical protein [Bradyrhizobium sp. CCGB12]MCP3387953.1 hypothetical protein [Bradyrhizobium sp. CCGB12]
MEKLFLPSFTWEAIDFSADKLRIWRYGTRNVSDIQPMRIQPASFAFTLLLGLLASVPYSGIDMSLPALASLSARGPQVSALR